jgi:hypothetical protein
MTYIHSNVKLQNELGVTVCIIIGVATVQYCFMPEPKPLKYLELEFATKEQHLPQCHNVLHLSVHNN